MDSSDVHKNIRAYYGKRHAEDDGQGPNEGLELHDKQQVNHHHSQREHKTNCLHERLEIVDRSEGNHAVPDGHRNARSYPGDKFTKDFG